MLKHEVESWVRISLVFGGIDVCYVNTTVLEFQEMSNGQYWEANLHCLRETLRGLPNALLVCAVDSVVCGLL